MEALSLFGVAAFCLAATLIGLPKEVRTLNKKVKRLSKSIEGDKGMSKLLQEIIGKKCAIYTNGIGPVGVVLAVDEDWVKLEIDKKKDKKKILLYPIESIINIEVMN